MSGRVDPFAILKEPTAFTTKPKPEKRVEEAAIAEVARQNNFPSRQAPKAKAAPNASSAATGPAVIAISASRRRVKRSSDSTEPPMTRNVPLGEVLRLALDALERSTPA